MFELARRVAGSGVTANAVHPGLTRTGLMRQASAPLRGILALMSAPVDKVADRIAPLLLDDAYASANGQFFHKGRPIDPPKSTRDVVSSRTPWSSAGDGGSRAQRTWRRPRGTRSGR